MKRILIKYNLIIIPLGLILAFMYGFGINSWIETAISSLVVIITGFMFYELVQLITIEEAKKNSGIYISIVIGIMVVSVIFTEAFNENSLLTMIVLNVMFAIIGIMVFNIAKAVQNSRAEIGCLLYFVVLILIGIIIIITILFFAGVFDTGYDLLGIGLTQINRDVFISTPGRFGNWR
jgi:hypothetical protein